MQVFEFYFNPPQVTRETKIIPDLIFDSFSHEAENIYERRIGSLYLVGSLKSPLPKNFRFLESLAKVIKGRYYGQTLTKPDKSLKESLRKANEYLESLTKSGDITWLGNLSFVVMSIKNYDLNFTKVGAMKTVLLREDQLIDIDKKLKFEDIEPYPLKIFGRIISGRLTENDLLFITTKDVFEKFSQIKIFDEIIKSLPFDYKKIKEIFEKKTEELAKVSGICVLIYLSKEEITKRKEIILKKVKRKEFSFKEFFKPFINFFKNTLKKIFFRFLDFFKDLRYKFKFPTLKIQLPKFKLPGKKEKQKVIKKQKKEIIVKPQKERKIYLKIFKIILGKLFKLPKKRIPKEKFEHVLLPRNIILLSALILILILGFILFRQNEQKELENYRIQLQEIREKISLAENYLVLAKVNPAAEKKAGSILQESLDEILPIIQQTSNISQDFKDEALSVKEKILAYLNQINKLTLVENPELFYEFSASRFIPQKLVSTDGTVYVFSPYDQNLFRISQNKDKEYIRSGVKLDLASYSDEMIYFFSNPQKEGEENKITNAGKITPFYPDKKEFGVSQTLTIPYPDFSFAAFRAFNSNIYFLDEKSGEIIKYPAPLSKGKDFPRLVLSPQTKKATDSRSFAVDSSLWILNKNNTISRYYLGQLQENIILDFFPEPEYITKIMTSPELPYLYLFEPGKSRVVILNKTGKIVKQLQMPSLNNMLDFTISTNGKTMWLLDGLSLYKVSI